MTLGPLVDFTVDGKPAGTRIEMSRSGGTVDVAWIAESVMIPMARVELIVNGEVRESKSIDARRDSGSWRGRSTAEFLAGNSRQGVRIRNAVKSSARTPRR